MPKTVNNASLVRRPPSPRGQGQGQGQGEKTLQEKLKEIKRLREQGKLPNEQRSTSPAEVKQTKRLIINGKPVHKLLGDWAQMSSSKGKKYYFHLKVT